MTQMSKCSRPGVLSIFGRWLVIQFLFTALVAWPTDSDATEIKIKAAFYTKANGAGTGQCGEYGSDILLNGTPCIEQGNFAEWEFTVDQPEKFILYVEYASAQSRPVRISVNGKLEIENGLAATTGCWTRNCLREIKQGEFSLKKGKNILQFARDSIFPHIRTIRLVSESDSAARGGLQSSGSGKATASNIDRQFTGRVKVLIDGADNSCFIYYPFSPLPAALTAKSIDGASCKRDGTLDGSLPGNGFRIEFLSNGIKDSSLYAYGNYGNNIAMGACCNKYPETLWEFGDGEIWKASTASSDWRKVRENDIIANPKEKLQRERQEAENLAYQKRVAAEENRFQSVLNSKDPQAMYLAAGTYDRNGDRSKASAIYESIISRFSSSLWAVKASDQLSGNNAATRASQTNQSQSRQTCEAQKMTCIASCPVNRYSDGSVMGPENSCKRRCESVSCS